MLRIKYRNALGEVIEMGQRFPYILGRSTGFGANEVNTMLSKGYNQNGSYYMGTLDEARTVSMTVYFDYATLEEEKTKRKHIVRLFNPRLGMGQLEYEDDTGRYIIDAVVSVKPEIYKLDDKEYAMTKAFDVVLTCPKPDWKKTESTQIKMRDFIGGLAYAKTYPLTYAERGDGGKVEYAGDNPAPIILDFRVKEGGVAVVNPRIENHLGEFIKISKTIEPGQKILISTNPDSPSVTFVDEDGEESDAWDSWVFGSSFIQLYPDKHEGTAGLNVFTFAADSGDPELYMTYREHYAGV